MNDRNRSGVALVFCAPSGTGKTTLVRRLVTEYPRLSFSLSCTTRAMRPGEVDGRDYSFISQKRFQQMRDDGCFAEWAEVHGNLYGTPLATTTALLNQGRDVLFDIDVQGAAQLKQTLPGAAFAFLLPPSRAALELRLKGRGSESEASLALRLANAREELAQANWFDFWIINDDLEKAYANIRAVYAAASLSPARKPEFVNKLLQDWP